MAINGKRLSILVSAGSYSSQLFIIVFMYFLQAVSLIRPTETIELHPVSTLVNNSRNSTPDCIEPIVIGYVFQLTTFNTVNHLSIAVTIR